MEKEDQPNGPIEHQSRNWFDNLSEEQIIRLNRSLEQADNGEFISNEDMKTKYAAWLK